ncbi:hypothetical protein TacPo2_63 [Pantoea bacteriophage TacPo2]
MADDNKPNSLIKEWLMGVATSLSVITLGLALTLYTDVQILKAKQEQQSSLATVVSSLEKQVALNNQALDAVKDALRELKEDKRK